MNTAIINKVKVISILFVLLTLFGSYVSLDWSRVLFFPADVYIEPYMIVRIFKLASSFLCAFLVWTTFSNKFTTRDSRKIKLAFVVVFTGDVFFTFGITIAGVAAFAAGQILLTIRNADGLRHYIKNKLYIRDKVFNIVVASLIFLTNAAAFYFVYYKNLGLTPLFYVFAVYSLFLCLSVWFGWVCIKIDYFADINSILIAVGMTFFLFCDFTVGYNLASPDPQVKVIVSSLTWMFYAPALILLSLSSYNFESFVRKKRFAPSQMEL